jgi:tetratricopeptide (TPR) repeat protein
MRHIVCVAMMVSVAGAQPTDNRALAEQLFNEARDLVKAERWREACPKFEASLRYDPVLGTRLNLATCYEHIGKLASAWGLYRESVELARKAGDTKRAEYAQKQAAALEPRLPKLAISAPPSPPPGLVVKRDETAIAGTELGMALFVDPGPHTVTATAPGFEPVTLNITVAEGKNEVITIPALVAKPEAPKVEPPKVDPEEPVEVTAPPKTRLYAAIGAGAGGLVAVGVGLVFGARAKGQLGDAEELCGKELKCSVDNFARGKTLVDSAHTSANISTVLVIAGGAAIAAGVVLFLTAPRASAEERATARLVPVPHEGGAALTVVGSF